MSVPTLSFTTKFNLSLTPKIFTFVDTTNYAGSGITTSNVNGCFTITAPSGIIIYNNTDFSNSGCDIRVSASTTNQHSISLPVLGSTVEAGMYTILYTVKDITASPVFYTLTKTYTYVYTSPIINIFQDTDCISPLFTSTDITNYVVGGITPTQTEVHTIYFPAGLGLSPLVGSSLVLTAGAGAFGNGTQTTIITSTLTYVFADGLIVYDVITGFKDCQVDCVDTCAIYCCIRSLEQTMMGYATTNETLYEQTRSLFAQIMGLVGAVTLARACNKSTDISGYLTTIKALAHCTDDCSCSGDSPSLVYGLGTIINNVIVQSGGTEIEVTPVVVGTTTTYTLILSPTFLTFVYSRYNTIVAPGDNITVGDSGIISGVRTFTVSGKESIVDQGYGVSVDVGVPTAGDTTYTVSVALSKQSVNDSAGKSLVVGNMKLMTADLNVAETGTYLCIYEACVETGAAITETDFNYSFMKNGAYSSISQVARFDLTGLDNPRLRICMTDFIILTGGDLLNVWGEILGGGDGGGDAIVTQSLIRILRIS